MRKSYLNLLLPTFLYIIFQYHSYSQQDAQYTQYMYNTISVNPAYAGNRGALSLIGLHRNQWIGLDGAPRTQTLGLHTPITNKGKLGFGFSVVNDEIGPVDETYIDTNFSYTIYVNRREAKLSFGLKAGLHILSIDLQGLNKFVEQDRFLEQNINNKTSPLLGAGLYYTNRGFYIGFSVPNLLQTEHFDNNSLSSSNETISFLSKERINYYLITGTVLPISDNLKFKPALLTKAVFGSPLQVDLSANFLLHEKLTLGLSYRWSAAISMLTGFQISESMMIGFAYDRETTELGNTDFNDGSLEIFLRFEMIKTFKRMLTPRFF